MTEPVSQTMSASQAQQAWDELLARVGRRETRVLVEKDGTPVAAIISAEDLKRLIWLEEARRQRFKALEETWEAFKDVSPEEIEREVTRAITEVREENREREQRASRTPWRERFSIPTSLSPASSARPVPQDDSY